ncbi:MAG: nucleotidyltransferase domain-containing protein [Anaerolineales bacterium]|nr:nucleotidyltransferase domain-containing protein [Anaerolineales bacterium]
MIEKLLNDLIAWAQAQPEIIALYLYGSQAEGRANVLSDLDVAVMVQPDLAQSQLWRLEDRWAAQWPIAVDLCLLNLAPLSLRYQITAQGQRLWTADLGRVAEIESLIWREYWDMQPKLEQDWTRFVTGVMEQKDETEREQYQAALAKVRAVHQRVREASAGYTGDVKE